MCAEAPLRTQKNCPAQLPTLLNVCERGGRASLAISIAKAFLYTFCAPRLHNGELARREEEGGGRRREEEEGERRREEEEGGGGGRREGGRGRRGGRGEEKRGGRAEGVPVSRRLGGSESPQMEGAKKHHCRQCASGPLTL